MQYPPIDWVFQDLSLWVFKGFLGLSSLFHALAISSLDIQPNPAIKPELQHTRIQQTGTGTKPIEKTSEASKEDYLSQSCLNIKLFPKW